MREWGGIEVTEEFVDDLVEEWHENDNMPTSLHAFVIANTGWSMAEYNLWAVTGRLPK